MKEMDESANDNIAAGCGLINSNKPKEFSVAEVLAELDRTRRDLQAQI